MEVLAPVGRELVSSMGISTLWSFVRCDLNHVCTAFNEHTGVYVRFPPQEHVSETYGVRASYMLLYT